MSMMMINFKYSGLENLFNYQTFHLHRGYTYYKITNLDNRIANADQLLTTDIDRFCESTVDLYR